MRMTVAKDTLTNALAAVYPAVGNGEKVKQLLRNVKIAVYTDNEQAEIMGTDNELGVRALFTPLQTAEAGSVLVSAVKLMQIIRECTGEQLDFATENKDAVCVVQCGFGTFDLPCDEDAGAVKFPDPPVFDPEKDAHHEMPGVAFKDLAKKTVGCCQPVAQAQHNKAMAGVKLEFNKGEEAKFVATDGRRLAVCRGRVKPQNGAKDTGAATHLVPEKAMRLFNSFLEDDDKVRIRLDAREVIFEKAGIFLWSRLVDGNFPQYAGVYPKETSMMATVKAQALQTAVRQAMVIDGTVEWTFNGNCLTMRTVNKEQPGKAVVPIDLEYSGKVFSIKLAGKYINEVCQVLDKDADVRMRFQDTDKPMFMQVGENFDFLVMPLH